ncbi:MAG TPA: TRAP transporter substrate-binding protein DctP, partial [Bradyrhizobium sp.]
ATSAGNVEMCHTAAYYYFGKDPTWALFCAVPFGLNTRQTNAWFYEGEGMKLMNDFAKKSNIYAIPGGNTGAQMGGWFRKEIKEVADLNGLKFRIGGIAGQVLQKVGVVPQQLGGGDIYPALEKGTIDAAEWVGPYDDAKLGFQKVAKYYYYPGFWEGGTMAHAFCNLEKWNTLPKTYQAIVANAAANANTWMMARYDLQNPTALKQLVAGGTLLRPFNNEVLEACLKATNELWAEISAQNADFKKSIDAMQAYRSDEYLWWQVAEYTFDSFMIRSRTRG